MDLTVLHAMDPWDWPKDMPSQLLKALTDNQLSSDDLMKAVEMAGEYCVINDDLVLALLTIVGQADKPDKIRGVAAIALGPVLEDADTYGFEDPDDVPISEASYNTVQDTFEKLYFDIDLPKEVRRRILEASVRAPQSWHKEAIRMAYADPDKDWQLTAVFCMRYVHGFKKQILKALESTDHEIHCEAVRAAGASEVHAAWHHIEMLLTHETTEKSLLLAAIDASVMIHPKQASALLAGLLDSDDDDIVDVVNEALATSGGSGVYDDDDDDEGDDDDWY
ncbi:MAG: hypothetical protein K9N55_11115 [Phycisphaerae bacterium]|nr:hypothetical protein [Phycisphaerae bacterium]